MKKLLGVTVILLLAGCSVNKEYAERNKAAADLLLPDLRAAYGDTLKLDADQKKRRLLLLDEWEKSIKAAYEASR